MQNVTVFSDYICPFCFVGKRLAERLAEDLPKPASTAIPSESPL